MSHGTHSAAHPRGKLKPLILARAPNKDHEHIG